MSTFEFQKLFSRAFKTGTDLNEFDFTPAGSLQPKEALEVYRQGYPARLFEALGETYETLWKVLGDEDFEALCLDYISLHPSSSPNLTDYGEDFSKYLLQKKEIFEESVLLSDLAHFEWEFKECFHSAFESPLVELSSAIFSEPIENINFELLISLRAIPLEYPVYRLHGIDGDVQRFLEVRGARSDHPISLVRSENGVRTVPITSKLLEFLSILKSGSFTLECLTSYCAENSELTVSLISELAHKSLLKKVTVTA